MPSNDCPPDDDRTIRQSYNFAPGYHGLVYRADVPDSGAGKQAETENQGDNVSIDGVSTTETRYRIQGMKWGLIPFWTKRAPDYGSTMRTINCRDDSLATNGGMWNTMKQRKRCVVVCEGFYEWLKKNGGKEKIAHFVKRKDGQLMCFAGLWDCVKYEGQEDKLYTYTIITTDSNQQLRFLHDRMPVILEPGSDALRTWLDPGRSEWSKELQSLLKPYEGELECYPVDGAVGKVGNNSPSFVVPVDSKENKKNIANFFGNQKKQVKGASEEKMMAKVENDLKEEGTQIKKEEAECRKTEMNPESTEDNAPLPKSEPEPRGHLETVIKREAPAEDETFHSPPHKSQKTVGNDLAASSQAKTSGKPILKTERKSRSATSNGTLAKTPTKSADKKITSFFGT